LKKKVYFWTNIFFGFTIIEDIFYISIVYIVKTEDLTTINTMLALALIRALIWPIFFKYLKNKEVSGKISLG
jgi:hypothetical protein